MLDKKALAEEDSLGMSFQTPIGKRPAGSFPSASFLRVGHSLWAVVFAVGGGITARSFHEINVRKSVAR